MAAAAGGQSAAARCAHAARPARRRAQIANFAAVVDLVPNADPDDESIRLVPHAIYDALGFANLQQLSTFCSRDGYSGANCSPHACAARRARAREPPSSPALPRPTLCSPRAPAACPALPRPAPPSRQAACG